MIKSKAFDLLHILNQREFKKFGEFINSPIHNKNTRLVHLYEITKEYYPDFSDDELTKLNIYCRIIPGEKYKDNLMRKILSEFSGKVLEFLAYLNFKKDRLELNRHLISELNKRNAEKYFEETYKDAEDILRYPLSSGEMLDYKHSLELEKNTSFLKKNKFLLDESILNESDYLIKFFLVKILRRYTYILNEQIYERNVSFKLSFLDEILKHLRINAYSDIPAIALYYNIVMLMLSEDEKCLGNIKKMLDENEIQLEQQDVYNAYFILNNYYRKKKDEGNSLYTSELFELYKKQLAKRVHKIEQYMHPAVFLNIVRTGTRMREFEWVEKFINEYIDEIDPCYRENTKNFSAAMLNFSKKNYNESMQYLSMLKFNGYYHKLDIYTYRLRIYYELNETEPMLSLMDSYSHVLSKDRLIPEFKKIEYKSFIKFLNYLIKIRLNDDYGNLGKLKKELINVHSVSCTGWFWDKFKELEVKRA